MYEGRADRTGALSVAFDSSEWLPFVVVGARLRLTNTHYHIVTSVESIELQITPNGLVKTLESVTVRVYGDKIADPAELLRRR